MNFRNYLKQTFIFYVINAYIQHLETQKQKLNYVKNRR